MILLDILVSGVVLGGVYALTATGLTLQYGVSRILNLAYGELFVAAAFGAYLLVHALRLNPLTTLVLVVPAAFALNYAVYRFLLSPLVRRARDRGRLEVDSILLTFGLLFVVQGTMLVFFGGNYYSYSYLAVPVDVVGSTVSLNRLIAFGVAMVMGALLYLWLHRTRAGTAVRAVAVDPAAARLVAIDVPTTSALVFAAGGALAAAGGVLVSLFLTFTATSGVTFTMRALVVVIMGGAGNVVGALAAGMLLGVAETAVARLLDPGLTLAANFALFMLVLLVRPTGLFGRRS